MDNQGRVASSGEDGTLRTWQLEGEHDEVLRLEHDSGCCCATLIDNYVIGGFRDGSLRLYDLDSGDALLEAQVYEEGYVSALQAAKSSAGYLVLSGSNEGMLVFSWISSSGTSVIASVEDVLQHRGSQISATNCSLPDHTGCMR